MWPSIFSTRRVQKYDEYDGVPRASYSYVRQLDHKCKYGPYLSVALSVRFIRIKFRKRGSFLSAVSSTTLFNAR